MKPAFDLAEPSTMKPSPHLSMQVSFLHRTNPFSTAAGSAHLVHLPSSPETAGLASSWAKAKARNKFLLEKLSKTLQKLTKKCNSQLHLDRFDYKEWREP